ncbi:FAD/NAD(P)-binding domain-containing protein, partial [Aureobasidium melanogenum]
FTTKEKAKKAKILSRSEKWIIPRNPIIDMLLAFNILGQETIFSWIPERLLRKFFYRDLADIAPPPGSAGLFEETPMVNNDVLEQIRSGNAEWLRGDILEVEENGIRFNRRQQGVPKNGPGHETLEEGEVIIMATGYKRPSLSFLPEECFAEPYSAPNWYLQTFPPQHKSICANNCTYVGAIGTVGNFHIGIYTRILLMFLLDPLTRPSTYWMQFWVDMTRWLKARAPTGAFDFFTYSELIWWFFFCVTINPFRWKWALFVFTGVGIGLPLNIVDKEDKIRNGLGRPADYKTHTY